MRSSSGRWLLGAVCFLAGLGGTHWITTAVEASGVLALPATVVQTNKANTYGAFKQDMSAATWAAPGFAVGSLPSAAANSGVTVQVTDGNAANDCTVGGGSTIVWCRSNGVAWGPVGGASAGAGTVNSGTSGQAGCYTATGTTISGCSNMPIHGFGAAFDGGGTALTSGKTVYVTVPYACTIKAYSITADTGTVSFDVWKIATGSAIPTIANTIINGSNYLALSSGTAVRTAVSGGTPFTSLNVTANDIVGINIQAVASATLLNLVIQCDATAT